MNTEESPEKTKGRLALITGPLFPSRYSGQTFTQWVDESLDSAQKGSSRRALKELVGTAGLFVGLIRPAMGWTLARHSYIAITIGLGAFILLCLKPLVATIGVGGARSGELPWGQLLFLAIALSMAYPLILGPRGILQVAVRLPITLGLATLSIGVWLSVFNALITHYTAQELPISLPSVETNQHEASQPPSEFNLAALHAEQGEVMKTPGAGGPAISQEMLVSEIAKTILLFASLVLVILFVSAAISAATGSLADTAAVIVIFSVAAFMANIALNNPRLHGITSTQQVQNHAAWLGKMPGWQSALSNATTGGTWGDSCRRYISHPTWEVFSINAYPSWLLLCEG